MNENIKVELQNVKKAFGSKVVLDGIDLKVNEGESLVIIGGSGSGKSVMLKCILGLMNPDSGTVKIDGLDTADLKSQDSQNLMRKFGMLFQGGALFDSMKVWENMLHKKL